MYAIVQHSACGYTGDATFEKGLETRKVTSKADVERVKAAGGVLFDEYTDAEDYCDKAQYPAGYEGLVPQADGTFSTRVVDGLKIYVPVAETAAN